MKYFIIVFIFFSCNSNRIIGRYKTLDLHSGYCKNLISLKKDYTFTYKQDREGKIDSIVGKWTLKKDTVFFKYNVSQTNICLPKKLRVKKSDTPLELRAITIEDGLCKYCNDFISIVN